MTTQNITKYAAIAISILVFISVLSINCNAQNNYRTEDFINAYVKFKKLPNSDTKYFIYSTTLVDCKSSCLSVEKLQNNYKSELGIYNPIQPNDGIEILNYLSHDDLKYMKQQLEQIKSVKIDRRRLSRSIKVIKKKRALDKTNRMNNSKRGIYHFSSPIFSRDSLVAIVFKNSHSFDSGAGHMIIYQQNADEWKIMAFVETWICFISKSIPQRKSFVKRIFTSKRR